MAEYLAHGYTISDNAIQRAIALDKKHGVYSRFTHALTQYDEKYHVTDRAKGIDANYGITEKAAAGWRGMASYFEKALGTPTGQKLANFYTQGDKQVRDIHAEARRLADIKSGKGEGEKGNASGSGNEGLAENEKTLRKLEGSEKTVCECGGKTGVCPCQEGKCACDGCSKADTSGEKEKGDHTATGPAAEIAASSDVSPLEKKH